MLKDGLETGISLREITRSLFPQLQHSTQLSFEQLYERLRHIHQIHAKDSNHRLKWYPKNKKIVPEDLELSPNILLIWLMDDGSYKENWVIFNTQSFQYNDNIRLANLLTKEIGINVKVKRVKYKGYDKEYYILQITHKQNLTKLIKYIELADNRLFKTLSTYYGWKLSSKRKTDFIRALPRE